MNKIIKRFGFLRLETIAFVVNLQSLYVVVSCMSSKVVQLQVDWLTKRNRLKVLYMLLLFCVCLFGFKMFLSNQNQNLFG